MKAIFIVTLCFTPLLSFAQTNWYIEINSGLPINIISPLIIKQKNQPTIRLWARYYSEPYTLPVYWDIKLSRKKSSTFYELELMHHKLYLQNKTNEIQHFGISHGFNLLIFNTVKETKHFISRWGLGIVIAHPESEIRGKRFGDAVNPYDLGYYITGPVIQYAISKPFIFTSRINLNTELKLLATYSYTPIAEGYAHVWYMGIHLLAGLQGLIYQSSSEINH